jgi:hypothetical protein
MTYFWAFIGELSDGPDPLDWGGSYNGNQPKHQGPDFPWLPGKVRPYACLTEKMASGKLKWKQVDWGSSAAIATKQDILDFIAEVYGGNEWRTDPKVEPRERRASEDAL